MLKQGGPQVFIFLMIASVLVILQDVLAVALSYATGIHPVSYTHLARTYRERRNRDRIPERTPRL